MASFASKARATQNLIRSADHFPEWVFGLTQYKGLKTMRNVAMQKKFKWIKLDWYSVTINTPSWQKHCTCLANGSFKGGSGGHGPKRGPHVRKKIEIVKNKGPADVFGPGPCSPKNRCWAW